MKFQAVNMASEKTPALIIPTNEYDEKKPQTRYCSKSFVSWVLAALLVALIVALCVQFAFPVYERHHHHVDTNTDTIDTVHIFQGTPVQEDQEEVKPPWHLDFLINPTRLCDTKNPPGSEAYQKDPEIKLLVLVPSAISHFEHRNTIRKTWGSVSQKSDSPVRVGFVLGTTSNSTERSALLDESAAHGDLIQADFADTYRNLTAKSVAMLKWVTAHCAHAQYFLKADDDTFVNLDVLSRVMAKPQFSDRDRFIGGFVHQGAQPIRTPSEKHYVSESDFPDSEFPPYASGSAYLTTGPTATELYQATQRVKPWLPLEDVYITGLCGDDISASLIHDPCFEFQTEVEEPASWDRYSNLATAHGVNPNEMDTLWNLMNKSLKDTIAGLEGGKSSVFNPTGFQDSAPSIFDMLNLMGIKPMSMSMSITNTKGDIGPLEKFFKNWPPKDQFVQDDTSDIQIGDLVNQDKKENISPVRTSAFAGDASSDILKFINDVVRQDNMFFDDDESQSGFWPNLSLFPFGSLNKGGKPGFNITTYLLVK